MSTNHLFFIISGEFGLMVNHRCATCAKKIEATKGMIVETNGGQAKLIFFCNEECYDNYEQ